MKACPKICQTHPALCASHECLEHCPKTCTTTKGEREQCQRLHCPGLESASTTRTRFLPFIEPLSVLVDCNDEDEEESKGSDGERGGLAFGWVSWETPVLICEQNTEAVPPVQLQPALCAYRSEIEIGRTGSPTVTTTTFWFVDNNDSNQTESISRLDQLPPGAPVYHGYRGLSSSPSSSGLDFLFVQSIQKENDTTSYYDRTSHNNGLSTELVVRSDGQCTARVTAGRASLYCARCSVCSTNGSDDDDTIMISVDCTNLPYGVETKCASVAESIFYPLDHVRVSPPHLVEPVGTTTTKDDSTSSNHNHRNDHHRHNPLLLEQQPAVTTVGVSGGSSSSSVSKGHQERSQPSNHDFFIRFCVAALQQDHCASIECAQAELEQCFVSRHDPAAAAAAAAETQQQQQQQRVLKLYQAYLDRCWDHPGECVDWLVDRTEPSEGANRPFLGLEPCASTTTTTTSM